MAERDEASKGASSVAPFHSASGMPANFGTHSAVDFRSIHYLIFYLFIFAQLSYYPYVVIQK
jgi:hypothetical protein